MDYANYALYGFAILAIIHSYYFYLNLNSKQNNLIIFGSALVTIGLIFATIEKYDYLKKKPRNNNIIMSHLILGMFGLLSFVFPNTINRRTKQTDIFKIIGHIILVNSNFGYQEIANISLTIYYSLYVYRNGTKDQLLDNIQAIGGGLVLLYYIKKTIDDWYTKKEQKFLVQNILKKNKNF
jgi:hypothetical protein